LRNHKVGTVQQTKIVNKSSTEVTGTHCTRPPPDISPIMPKTIAEPPPPVARIKAHDIPHVIARMRAGERRAIASVITELERHSAAAPALLQALQPHLGHALVVGFTGPPGAGKSTLVNALITELRRLHRTVGVIAVDPSSPVSGGAILGDRIRMTAALDDDGVFVRSLASRGYLGGLSPAAVRIIDALDGAGFDIILLETVGTGQSEIDVAEVADIRVVIAAPGLGDDIQAMKSGLLEIADVIVVNKADRPGAEQTQQQLIGALSIRATLADKVPVLKTSALTGEGVAELIKTLDSIGDRVAAEGPLARRRRRARYLIARAASDIVAARIKAGGKDGLDPLADAVLCGTMTPNEAAARLLKP
jgi:LAO/AO transport system kinase